MSIDFLTGCALGSGVLDRPLGVRCATADTPGMMSTPRGRGWGAAGVGAVGLIVVLLAVYLGLILVVGAYADLFEFSDPLGTLACLALAFATPAAVLVDRRVCLRRGQPLSVSRSTAIGLGVVVVVAGAVALLSAPL